MAIILWDASSLAKRYTQKAGRETVNALFAAVPSGKMQITPWGYAETYSILLRKHNSGILDFRALVAATNALRTEVISDPDFGILSITDALIFGSLALIGTHNINSADAAILSTYLRFLRSVSEPCLLAASDRRLLRASNAEGLATLNPEQVSPPEVPAILAA